MLFERFYNNNGKVKISKAKIFNLLFFLISSLRFNDVDQSFLLLFHIFPINVILIESKIGEISN